MEISVTPNYTYIFDFENDFIHQRTRKWMIENWTMVFLFSGIYMIIVFGGQMFMQNRPRFELRKPLFIWNLLLAAFSIMGAIRTTPELIHVLRHYGLYHSICVPSYIEQDRVCGFWTWLFVLSKLPELGDTIFIVLRKQQLIFLHWYHHITVLIYSWFSYTEYTSSARWFIVMNYCIHSVMYSYYAIRICGFRTPRCLSMIITTLQMSQMVVGCAINFWALGFLRQHGSASCHISQTNINLSIAMYFSYFVLFAHFFYQTYFSSEGKISKSNTECNNIGNGQQQQRRQRRRASPEPDSEPSSEIEQQMVRQRRQATRQRPQSPRRGPQSPRQRQVANKKKAKATY